MLQSLNIKNFALIENVCLTFEPNFNVLVGETGAGKSIIIKALQFALGEKSDRSYIRTGEKYLRVEASFSNIKESTKLCLSNFGIEDAESLIIARTLSLDGKTDARINGQLVSQNMLKSIGETLADVFAQHSGVEILNSKNHLSMLDSYNSGYLQLEKAQMQELFISLQAVKSQIAELGGDEQSRQSEIELLDFQIKEITSIDPVVGEDTKLKEKIDLINNSEKLANYIKQALVFLRGNNGGEDYIKNALLNLNNAHRIDSSLSILAERFENLRFELSDIANELENYQRDIYYDEYELKKLDERLDSIKNLKRKFGGTIESVLDYLENAENKINKLRNNDELLSTLSKQHTDLQTKIEVLAESLSKKRKLIALEIERKVVDELKVLGMKNTKFKIDFQNKSPSPDGIDNISFLFSANAGQGLKSLSKTISGGEMSRFMLALKNIIADKDGVDLLIFDEVDSGISGEIGSLLAEKMARLSRSYQVICITHLPQVTAMGDTYYYVYKKVVDNVASTNYKILDNKEIIDYIALLSGGSGATLNSIAHAKELKAWGNGFKANL